MENITLIGESVRILGSQVDDAARIANGSTVHDASRVYLVYVGSDSQQYELITQMRLQNPSEAHDEITNPYNVVVGSFYIVMDVPIILQKNPTDKIIRSWTNNNLFATPVFDRD